jgi:hypothetical protein
LEYPTSFRLFFGRTFNLIDREKMMSKITSLAAICLALSVASCCHQKTVVPAGTSLKVEIEVIAKDPAKFSDRLLETEGVLKNAGGNYFTDLRLVLTGNKGGEIEVTAWAPLEVPPPRPGPNRPRRPKVMSDFLDRRMRLTGRLEDQSGKLILRVEKAEEIIDREGKDEN